MYQQRLLYHRVICFASILSITIPCIIYLGLYILHHRALKITPILLVSIYVVVIELFRLVNNPAESFNLYVNSMSVLLLVYAVVSEISEKPCEFYCMYKILPCIFHISIFRYNMGYSKVARKFSIDYFRWLPNWTGRTLDETVTGIFSINANGIALMSMVAISLTMLLYSRKHLSNGIAIPLIIYYSIVGLLTVSKTFILVYIGFWCLYICWYTVSNHHNLFKTLALIMCFFIAIRLLWNTDMVQNIIIRFDVNDLTTGRIDVAAEYLEFMRQNNMASIFGIGLQDVTGKTSLVHVPHNAMLEIYVCFGGIGIIAYIVFFIFTIMSGLYVQKNESNNTHPSFINFIPFIVFFIFIQSLQFLRINYIYASIAMTFAGMSVNGFDGRGEIE